MVAFLSFLGWLIHQPFALGIVGGAAAHFSGHPLPRTWKEWDHLLRRLFIGAVAGGLAGYLPSMPAWMYGLLGGFGGVTVLRTVFNRWLHKSAEGDFDSDVDDVHFN